MSSNTVNCDDPGFLSDDPGIERLLDNVQAQVPGLTTDMANLACWNTIEHFYMASTYRRELIYWRMEPGQIYIDFDPYDQDWRVSRFLFLSGSPNLKIEPPGRVRDLSSTTPDSERKGQVYLALKPRSVNTKLPYDLWTTYWEALLSGALYRLCMQPGKPYSDLQAASVHAKLYRSGIASARADAQAHHLRDGSEWSFPYFASGGSADGRRG